MEIDFIIANRLSPTIFIPEIIKAHHSYYKQKAFEEYYTEFHDVMNHVYRPQKQITVPDATGAVNPDTNAPLTHTKFVEVNRIVIGLQKLIVSRKTSFTTGGLVTIKSNPVTPQEEQLYELITDTWSNNKLQYKNAELFKSLISETEVCEVWYSDLDDENEPVLKCNIYSPSKGYDLIPVYDSNKDLVLFSLKYKVELVNYMRVWDKDLNTLYVDKGQGWVIEEAPKKHNYGKIPVIYYQVEQSCWEDAQRMIDRLEELMSNFADTNDYNGSPILAASGEVTGFMEKGERGKAVQLENGGDLKYVSWDSAPASIKLEIETLLKLTFMTLQVPDISFDSMKGLGGLSGVAFDRILIDAHLSAIDFHNGVYGEGIQRRINFFKSALSAMYSLQSAKKLIVSPHFSLFSINSDDEKIATAMKANGNKPVMSQKESIKYVGLTDDVEATLNDINSENVVNE